MELLCQRLLSVRLFLVAAMTFIVRPQSVIDEELLYEERCASRAKSNEKLQNNIDFIAGALREQTHENMLLRQEVEELKLKYLEQRELLSQLSETMGKLVQKVKYGQKSCSCPEPEQPDIETTAPGNPQTAVTEERDTSRPTIPQLTSPSVQSTVTPTDYKETSTQQPDTMITHSSPPVHSQKPSQPDVTGNPLVQSWEVTSGMEETETFQKTTHAHRYPRDCHDLLLSRPISSGSYWIHPRNASRPSAVYCQIENDTAWTVVQRRDGGQEDFFRDWGDYRAGFGDPEREFWAGNDLLHHLTNQGHYRLRIDLWDWAANHYYAESSYVSVSSESEFYRLYTPDDYYAYSGFGGSGLRVHRGPFMTFDRQDPTMISDNCARMFHCGWWFTTCVRNANLNGKYYQGGYHDLTAKTRNINDIYWHNINQSLKRVEIKLIRSI